MESTFKYRAILKNYSSNKYWWNFSIEDCPALIYIDTFILTGVEGSPLLLFDTIVRGDKDSNIYEGDIAVNKYTEEVEGIVVYDNGFFVQKDNRSDKKVIDLNHIYLKKGNLESIGVLLSFYNRTPIRFKSQSIEFGFEDMTFISNNFINAMIKNKVCRFRVNSISELIYFNSTDERSIYSGEFIGANIASLNNVQNL